MYESGSDPYCYPNSSVLKNRLDIRDQAALDAFEAMITAQRGEEPLPRGRLGFAHYRALHRHLFQDVYEWAGRVRTVRIAKGDSMFCYPENIDVAMRKLFGELAAADFFRNTAAADFARQAAAFFGRAERDPSIPRGQRASAAQLFNLAGRPCRPFPSVGANEPDRDFRRDGRELPW